MFRSIWARNSLLTVFLGPIVKSIEKSLFSLDHPVLGTCFVKGLSPAQRSQVLDQFAGNYHYFVNDFESYESCLKRTLTECTELPLYEHYCGKQLGRMVFDCFYSTNFAHCKFFTVLAEPRRCSGDVCTSLGNTWTNFVVSLFILTVVLSLAITSIRFLVEGDDNITRSLKPIPISNEHYSQFGLIAKVEKPRTYAHASFCGLLLCSRTKHIITDPAKVLMKFFWVPRKYVKSSSKTMLRLYRAKAMSYLSQYHNCPIIGPLCAWVLSNTDGLKPLFIREWKEQWVNVNTDFSQLVIPNPWTREFMDDCFGITPVEQLEIEQQFVGPLRPYHLYACVRLVSRDCIDFYSSNFTTLPRDRSVVYNKTLAQLADEINRAAKARQPLPTVEATRVNE
jgi:hypothetical protein